MDSARLAYMRDSLIMYVIRTHEIWDIEDLRGLAEQGWEALSQETINGWVETMPQRRKDVIAADGQLTAW